MSWRHIQVAAVMELEISLASCSSFELARKKYSPKGAKIGYLLAR
jgi:hypothetical protein